MRQPLNRTVELAVDKTSEHKIEQVDIEDYNQSLLICDEIQKEKSLTL